MNPTYLEFLKQLGFQLVPEDTSADFFVTSFHNRDDDSHKVVKQYFKLQGFTNIDGRTYMAHTGNPHINLDNSSGWTVQISWGRGRGTGVSFLRWEGLL